MFEDKIEISKAEAFTPVNESIAKQASEFLDSHGKSEMALTIRMLLEAKYSCNKNHLAVRHLDSFSLPNNGQISEVIHLSILIMIISINSTICNLASDNMV